MPFTVRRTRSLIAGLTILGSCALLPAQVLAQPVAPCEYILSDSTAKGFAHLRTSLAEVAGDVTGCPYRDGAGNVVQQTSRGLLIAYAGQELQSFTNWIERWTATPRGVTYMPFPGSPGVLLSDGEGPVLSPRGGAPAPSLALEVPVPPAPGAPPAAPAPAPVAAQPAAPAEPQAPAPAPAAPAPVPAAALTSRLIVDQGDLPGTKLTLGQTVGGTLKAFTATNSGGRDVWAIDLTAGQRVRLVTTTTVTGIYAGSGPRVQVAQPGTKALTYMGIQAQKFGSSGEDEFNVGTGTRQFTAPVSGTYYVVVNAPSSLVGDAGYTLTAELAA